MISPEAFPLRGRVPRPVSHELSRPGLLRDLDTDERRLIVLVAPAGYGKTTLLAQHARRREGRVVWVSVREDDRDPRVLAGTLTRAVERLRPTLPLTHSARMQALEAPSEGLASALALDLTASTTNLDLILDGVELLGEAAERWLERWIDALAEGHRVLLAGRAEPGLRLAQRVAREEARLLGIRELAFTLEETQGRLADRPPSESRAVHAQLEGWPAGIALVASGAAPQLTPAHLVREVLDRLPPPLRRALPEASVLEVWTEDGPGPLELPLAAGWVRAVRQAGLPLIPLGRAYRPHQLLREVLDLELRGQPQRHAQLHRQAGERAQQAGEELLALRHYRTAGDQEQALHLAARLAERYEARWEHRLVREVLEGFPEGALPPALQRLLGHALFETGEAGRGEALLRGLREAGDRSPALLYSLGVLTARSGQSAQQLALAEEGLGQSPGARDTRRLLRVKAAALLTLGRSDEACTVAQAAAERSREGHDRVEYGAALTVLQLAYRLCGQQEASEAALRRGLEVYAELGMPSRALLLQNDLADLLRERGEAAQALDLIAQALPVAEREQTIIHPLLLETRGDVHFWQAEYAAAAVEYRGALRLCSRYHFEALASRILPRLIEAAIRADDPGTALEALAWARVLAPDGRGLPSSALQFCEGLWARSREEWDAALRFFSQVGDAGLGAAFTPVMRARLYAAEAALEGGTFGAPDAERVQEGLAGAHRRHFLPSDGEVLRRVAAACVPFGWRGDTLSALLPPWPRPGAAVPELRLQVQALGPLRVRLAGQPLHLPLSRSGELLVWLALHGEATRDRIVDALWDGSAERRHVEYFKVAVRHLRLALSEHPAVTFNPVPFEGGLYRLSERFTVELDAQEVCRSLRSPAPGGMREAVAAYAGPFLPFAEAEWAEQVRTEVLEAAVAAALTLGAQQEHAAPEEAAALYERVIELDPLHEPAYTALLRLHTSRSNAAAARHVFGRYRRMLRDTWNREPGEEFGRGLLDEDSPFLPR